MKAKVVQRFVNKHNKKEQRKGEVLEISQERFEEINSTSFGVFVEEIKEGESGAGSTQGLP